MTKQLTKCYDCGYRSYNQGLKECSKCRGKLEIIAQERKNTSQEALQSTNSLGVKLILVGIMAIFLIGIVSATLPAYLQDNIVSCWTLDETSGTLAVIGLGLMVGKREENE